MLMMTPQFAASAGIVIAAVLAVNVPHAALTYGPNPPVRECAVQACVAPKPAPGKLTTSKPSVKLRPPRPRVRRSAASQAPPTGPTASSGAPTPSRPASVIEYRLIRSSDEGFVAMIIIENPGKPGNWTLSFAFAGAQVQHVWGAQWRPDSTGSGGVATGQPLPWPGQKPGSSRIVIFATGQSAAPASCSFDGASCSFS